MNTLLGGCRSEEEWLAIERDQTKNEIAYDRAREVAWLIWFDAYERGQISFEDLISNAKRSIEKLGVQDFLRWKLLGLLCDKALAITPPKRGKGNKGRASALKEICKSLVKMAADDGYPLSRAGNLSKISAFERVADELLPEIGCFATARSIENWYYESKK